MGSSITTGDAHMGRSAGRLRSNEYVTSRRKLHCMKRWQPDTTRSKSESVYETSPRTKGSAVFGRHRRASATSRG